jgi:outer membrane protein OmpA-like peptidoglycan-associated protein
VKIDLVNLVRICLNCLYLAILTVKLFFNMIIYSRVILFLAVVIVSSVSFAQEQDKEQSKLYMEQANEIMAVTRAIDDARDIMVTAANFDTTNIKANFEAGHMHIESIGRDLAVKYFLRIYRQDPNYRFDLEYWIANSYQYGLKFDKALDFYNRYRDRLLKKPNYSGRDKIEMKDVDRRIQECNNGKEFIADPKPYSITNMGREINSEFEDYGPVLNANESEIIFTTRRRDGNTNENVADDNKPYEDIFVANISGGKWSYAKNIGPMLNGQYSDSNLTLSYDGQLLFIYKDDGNGDIFVSEKAKNGGWEAPTPLPGIINSSARESSVSISADDNILFFASDRPGGYGASDIYMCTKDSKGEWSRVKNLGPTINTPYEEDGPNISFDGKTLYFSSSGHKTMGGLDIFKSTLVNADRNEWSEPENIGYPINSPDDDVYFTTSKDGKKMYYSSVREDGMGYTDIYVITPVEEKKKEPPVVAAKEPVKEEPKKEEPKKEEPVVVVTPKIEEPKKDIPPIILIPKRDEPKKEVPLVVIPRKEEPKKEAQPIKYTIKVVDPETKAPLEAKVRMRGLKDKVVVGSVDQGNGTIEFNITSTSPKDYQITVEREGYIFQTITERIGGASPNAKPVNKTIELRKLVVGAVSILRNIYFDFEKATFRTDSYGELNKLETMMKQNQNLKVELSGHTDFVGAKKFNKRLSEKRAAAVKSFLVSKGVDTRRIKTVGYGEERPLASNDDEKEGRSLNRRVEFRVLGN